MANVVRKFIRCLILFQAAEEKKDDRSRLAAIIREVDRFLSDGLVKVFHSTIKRIMGT
jgi:hypothetical protein